jgi:hypothetical protein
METAGDPLGARGPYSGREFDPDLAGGPIRRLSAERVLVSHKGIEVVERHVARFGPDLLNGAMVRRLREIKAGRLSPTQYDLNYYTHELREFVRYRRRGWPTGQPPNPDDAFDLWNHTHTAALEDYRLPAKGEIYHPDVMPW